MSFSEEGFNLNNETFRDAIRDFKERQDIPEYYLGPLSDSPPNPRCPRFYSGLRTSRLVAGAGPEMEGMEEGGSGQGSSLTTEQRLQQAHDQAMLLCAECDHLQHELEPVRKGKGLDRG